MGVGRSALEALGLTAGFWAGRRVLLTGHTGFKGAWLALWLQRLGAQVTGLALPPIDSDGAFCALGPWPGIDSHLVDIRDRLALRAVVDAADPQVVFHLAAQPLVRAGFTDPIDTYEVNVMGTVNLLAALGPASSLEAVVVVTTDKVYADAADGHPLAEDDRLGGIDAYSTSKACSELVAKGWSWPQSRPGVATARAGNVIGGGDVAPDRLLPDSRRAIRSASPLRLRYPKAVRPWQFVLEPLHGYLLLAEHLVEGPPAAPMALNFGPSTDACVPAVEVVERLFDLAGTGAWELEDREQPHESPVLRLDATLASKALGWQPRLDLEEALAWTLEWWRAEEQPGSLVGLAHAQIERYEKRLPG